MIDQLPEDPNFERLFERAERRIEFNARHKRLMAGATIEELEAEAREAESSRTPQSVGDIAMQGTHDNDAPGESLTVQRN